MRHRDFISTATLPAIFGAGAALALAGIVVLYPRHEYRARVTLIVGSKYAGAPGGSRWIAPSNGPETEQQRARFMDEILRLPALHSYAVIRRVQTRLTPGEIAGLHNRDSESRWTSRRRPSDEVIAAGRSIRAGTEPWTLEIEYRDFDRENALKLAGLLADEIALGKREAADPREDPLIERMKIQCDHLRAELGKLEEKQLTTPSVQTAREISEKKGFLVKLEAVHDHEAEMRARRIAAEAVAPLRPAAVIVD